MDGVTLCWAVEGVMWDGSVMTARFESRADAQQWADFWDRRESVALVRGPRAERRNPASGEWEVVAQ